ncbi:hypothetical protein [Streptomyces sp. MZ04]|uniref:hypothetical protein n=1 Tax=Streptomyces sp. MZ04 TaxID=2559236 RepID=UPI00107E88EF|nr:hypothetical protein [Streptomyces sp. MZ04]TGB07392.1 hypothetical protein E2651_21805 [Streptomyces sp. MZ04]
MATTQFTPAFDSSESVTRYSTITLMNRDWDVLCRDLRAADRVAVWAEQYPVLAGATNPQDIVDTISEYHRRGSSDCHDRVMHLLVERAGDEGFDGHLAWRIAVRILLPRAVLMAKTQRRTGLSWDDVCAAVFGAAFEIVRTYPLERRPRRIFNNIALDTLQLARRTLAACVGEAEGLQEFAAGVAPLAAAEGHSRFAHIVSSKDPATPHDTVELADLLMRAAQMELIDSDEPALSRHEARTEVLDLLLWAVEIGALTEAEAQRIARYYLSASHSPEQQHMTTRAMGQQGALLRKQASRAVRSLRTKTDLAQFSAAA